MSAATRNAERGRKRSERELEALVRSHRYLTEVRPKLIERQYRLELQRALAGGVL